MLMEEQVNQGWRWRQKESSSLSSLFSDHYSKGRNLRKQRRRMNGFRRDFSLLSFISQQEKKRERERNDVGGKEERKRRDIKRPKEDEGRRKNQMSFPLKGRRDRNKVSWWARKRLVKKRNRKERNPRDEESQMKSKVKEEKEGDPSLSSHVFYTYHFLIFLFPTSNSNKKAINIGKEKAKWMTLTITSSPCRCWLPSGQRCVQETDQSVYQSSWYSRDEWQVMHKSPSLFRSILKHETYPTLQMNWKITPNQVRINLCRFLLLAFFEKEARAQLKEKRDRRIEVTSVSETSSGLDFKRTKYTCINQRRNELP